MLTMATYIGKKKASLGTHSATLMSLSHYQLRLDLILYGALVPTMPQAVKIEMDSN